MNTENRNNPKGPMSASLWLAEADYIIGEAIDAGRISQEQYADAHCELIRLDLSRK